MILGTDFGAQLRASFDKDLAASTPITLQCWRLPLVARLEEIFGRLWEYWL